MDSAGRRAHDARPVPDLTSAGGTAQCPRIGPNSCSAVPGERRDDHGIGQPAAADAAAGVAYRLGLIDQVPYGEGRAFAVGGHQVAVFRKRDGSLRALSAVCPHKGGPIADGKPTTESCSVRST